MISKKIWMVQFICLEQFNTRYFILQNNHIMIGYCNHKNIKLAYRLLYNKKYKYEYVDNLLKHAWHTFGWFWM